MTEVEKMMRDVEFELNEKNNEIDNLIVANASLVTENVRLKDLNKEMYDVGIIGETTMKDIKEKKEETIWGFQLVNSSVHYTKNPIYDNERLVYIDEVELVDNDWIFKRLLKVNTKHIMLTWKVK